MSMRCSRCFEPLDSSDDSDLCPNCRAEAVGEKAPAPHVFGRYEILSEINRGAMGIVYRAKEESLGRTVALKVLLAGEHASPEQVGRFIREAKAIARLRHPNIVPIHDVGEVDGRHYFTMDYIEGEPLSRMAAAREIDPRRALDMIEEIADAIECAHKAGVVHRDIKPSNIMIDKQGRPLIMDFGLAKPAEGGTRYTRAGTTIGTPAYMPPEQARGEINQVGPRSDVYSIGAVLYELLTGVPPFDGDNMLEVILNVIHDDPVPPRKRDPKINADIQTIILHALEKDPALRYQAAADLRDDVRRYKAGQAIKARPPSLARHFGRWCWRRKFEVAMTAVVLAVVAGAWGFVQDLSRRAERIRREAMDAEVELERMRQSDKPVWSPKWEDASPATGEEGRWDERDSFLSGRDIVPRVPAPFLGSLKLTANFSIEEGAPEDVAVTCGLFSTQDPGAPVPFYGSIGGGKVRVHAVRDIEASGAAGSTAKDLAVLIERDAPPLRPGGSYLVKFERRGIDVRFQVAGEGVDEVLEVRNMHFSNWRAKNLYPAIGLREGVRWSAFRLDKLTAGKMDVFETADSLFFMGEYNGAQSDYSTILDSPRAPLREDAARLRLGMCAEIKRQFESALEWYGAVRGADDIGSAAEARLREPFCFLALGRQEEAARAFAALSERARREGSPEWDVASGPYAWKLTDLVAGFVDADMLTVAADVLTFARPKGGWSRMEAHAVRVGEGIARQGLTDKLIALADACRGADLAPAFAELTKLLADGGPDEALGVLAEARKRYPDRGGAFPDAARSIAAELIAEGRFADVTRVHETWPLESVAAAFEEAVTKATVKREFEDALSVLAFAHSVRPEHTDGLRTAAVDLARQLKREARFADVRNVFEAYPDKALAGELCEAVEGVIAAGDLSEAISLLEFARRSLGADHGRLAAAAAKVSEMLAGSASLDNAVRVRDSVSAYPSRAHVPHVRKAMAALAKAGRTTDAAALFAALRGRLPDGDAATGEDMLAVIEGIAGRDGRQRALDILAVVAPSLEHAPEARAVWLVEFGDVALRVESRPDHAEELYREAAGSDGGAGNSRGAAVAAGRLALLLEALGRREEATRVWESLLEQSGTPQGLREATKAVLARTTPESFTQWQAAHPADLSGAEMSLYLGMRALRMRQRREATDAFRRARQATRGKRWPYHILGRLGFGS
jgi:tetratricopeptide (TPR) repeat protein/predicted Ser/Thr protein kinase